MLSINRWYFAIRRFSALPREFRNVDTLPVPDSLKVSLRSVGVSRLTPIQSETFGPIILGQSITAYDKTGSGKTLAYLIPVLARLYNERLAKCASCVIVVPTQDLCQQIGSVLVSVDPSINVLLISGKGDPGLNQMLRQGPQVVIGTGGKISSLVRKGVIDFNNVKILVLDELDALLDSDYRKAVEPLLKSLDSTGVHNTKQLIAFGATRTAQLLEIMNKYPCLSNTADVDLLALKTSSRITHSVIKVPNSSVERLSVLASTLSVTKYNKAMVFANTIEEARAIVQHPLLSCRAKLLHGEMEKSLRDQILVSFKSGKISTLICTDITARGIDVPDVDLVISFRPPNDPVLYIHRAGRTGRMQNHGKAILLVSSPERPCVERIERIGRFTFKTESTPSVEIRKDTSMQFILEEATARGKEVDPRIKERIETLMTHNPRLCETVARKCIDALVAGSVSNDSFGDRRVSILSGEEGYGPVLFVDPGRTIIKNRSDLEEAIVRLGLPTGLVTLSESGFVVDIPHSQIPNITGVEMPDGSYVEVIAIKKLPRLVKDENILGRRTRGGLPWRRQSAVLQRKSQDPSNS
jgi:superfamily II DNA/RNA helicase